MTRLRYLAEINPAAPRFTALADDAEVTFTPLETVWSDARLDLSRRRLKRDVATGYVRFQDGDVLVPKVTPTFQAGRSTVVQGLVNGCGAGSTELHVLRARPGADPRFLAYSVRTSHFLAEGVSAFQGVAGLQRVPDLFLRNVSVPDWSPDEQRRIADFLDDQVGLLDSAIQLRQQQVSLGEEHLRAEAAGRLLTADPLLDGVPLRRLISTVKTGGTPASSEQWAWDDGTVPWYGPASIGQRLAFTTAARNVSQQALERGVVPQFAPDSVVIVGIGATAGRVAYLDHVATGNQQLTSLTPASGVDGRYLAWSLWVRKDMLLGTAPFTTLPILNNETLKVVRILSLSPHEQQAAVAHLDAAQTRQEAFAKLAERSISLLAERKQALITAAVTGEFDVTTARSVA